MSPTSEPPQWLFSAKPRRGSTYQIEPTETGHCERQQRVDCVGKVGSNTLRGVRPVEAQKIHLSKGKKFRGRSRSLEWQRTFFSVRPQGYASFARARPFQHNPPRTDVGTLPRSGRAPFGVVLVQLGDEWRKAKRPQPCRDSSRNWRGVTPVILLKARLKCAGSV